MKLLPILFGACSVFAVAAAANAESLTIATVNNGDMIVMQELSVQFEEATGHTLDWVVLEENILRQRVTTDIATGGGQFDVMTIGTYEVPIWANQGWLLELDNLGADYDVDDILPALPRKQMPLMSFSRSVMARAASAMKSQVGAFGIVRPAASIRSVRYITIEDSP